MSNNWNQQPMPNQPGERNGSLRARSGGMLREYRQQQQQQQYHQYSPVATPPSQGQGHNPYSPFPPGPIPQQVQQPVWPVAQSWPTQESPQGWVGNAMQTVRRWSGKVAAVQGGLFQQQAVSPSMTLYRPETAETQLPPKSKRWKRSHSMRVSMLMHNRRQRWKKKEPHLGRKIAVGTLFSLLLLLVVAVSSMGAYAYAFYQSQLPQLKDLANLRIPQTTHIYDRNGILLYDVYDNSPGGGRRTPITYDDVPRIMQDAMIAAEDHTFWTNSGIDPQGIIRAATEYAQTHAVQGGGSTITQQVIKNLTGNDQVTIDRKLTEGALAIGLTQQYTKQKILEMYFNVAGFGAQDEGVEAAVEEYFHLNRTCDKAFKCTLGIVHLNDDYNPTTGTYKADPLLGLARASLLAGMPQDPVNYDPTFPENRQRALARQKEVLDEMVGLQMSEPGLGLITPDVAQQAEALTAKFITKITHYNHSIRCPHFVYWVIQQAENALGGGETGVHAFLTGGFNIRTTIDANLEDYVEKVTRWHLQQSEYHWFISNAPLNTGYNVNDAAVVVMDAKTGEVWAMNGSADWNDNSPQVRGQVNAALSARQPGSSWKPIEYATAFEMGWYPGIVLPDVKTYFPTSPNPMKIENNDNPYHPTDYGNLYHNWRVGPQASIRYDIANSVNVPATKTLMYAGVDNVADTARRFGITALDDYIAQANQKNGTQATRLSQVVGPSFALGTVEIPLLQMVGAYQVFANQGKHIPPQGILDIWDNYGRHLYHYDPTHPPAVQVISPQIAYLITTMISDEKARAAEFFPDHELSFWDGSTPDALYPDVAAKTGTTQDFKDNLTVGYTSDLVVGVWAGNADGTPMAQNIVGITGAAPIWHSVIERASNKCPKNNPEGYNDGVDCGTMTFPFGIHTFVAPPGVHQGFVSAIDGLQGTGVTDYMLDGEDPMQPGYVVTNNNNNGNTNNNNNNTNNNNDGNTNGNVPPNP
jgi:membrane peptidoglycan carboxypeptidase